VLLGRLDHLMETGANDVLVVRACDGSLDQRERLIPWIPDEVILAVDRARRELLVDWDPEF
jgi:16S rRNA processing protein RimM